MTKIMKLALLPVKYVWVIGIVVALGLATGIVNMPGSASAQVALDCNSEVIDNECVQQQRDVCWNIEGTQTEVPSGYHVDQTQDNACVKDPVDPGPQVLGASTSTPQVLAETTPPPKMGK